jgi:hypothetical protein
MESFKAFISKQKINNNLPLFHTVFGKHSKESESSDLNFLSTVYGKHSKKSEWPMTVPMQTEAADPTTARDQIAAHSKQAEKNIHNSNKLKDDRDESLLNHSIRSLFTNSTLYDHANGHKVYSQQVNNIDKIMSKARISNNTHVFTGIKFSPDKFFKKKGSGEMATTHLPAFTSTTTDFNQAIPFGYKLTHDMNKHPAANRDEPQSPDGKIRSAHHVLKLLVPAGTPGGSIRHLAQYNNENEILLHRGLNVEVHPHPTIIHHHEHGHVVVWHARVVGHDPKDFPKL